MSEPAFDPPEPLEVPRLSSIYQDWEATLSDEQRAALTGRGETRKARWLAQNRDAIETYREMIDRDGLTLDQYRQF